MDVPSRTVRPLAAQESSKQERAFGACSYGPDGRPQSCAVSDSAVAGTSGAKYRLLEVDVRGQQHVLAVTVVQVAASARITRTTKGLQLSLAGTPDTSLVIETATDVAVGPWTEAGTVQLDEARRGVLSLTGDTAEPMRFYRWTER